MASTDSSVIQNLLKMQHLCLGNINLKVKYVICTRAMKAKEFCKKLKELNASQNPIVINVFYIAFDELIAQELKGKSKFQNSILNINQFGLSWKHIFDAIGSSLRHLGIAYIGL